MRSLNNLKPLALLLLRLALAVIFVHYGYPKLFVHPRQNVQWFVQHGFPGYFGYLSGVIEFFGGLLLAVGLFTRIAAIALFVEMVVALWKVHGLFSHPAAVQNYQFPLMMAVGAFVLVALGAGVVSLDYAFFREGRKLPRRPKVSA